MGGNGSRLHQHWGWVVTAASFLMFTVSTGTLGVFVLLYVYFEREFQDTATAIGWIGSLGSGLLNLMSLVSSPLYERFTRRKVIFLGVILCIAGIVGTSFAKTLWQTYMTFGIIFATGLNFICNPALNMMTVYFPGRNCVRATAFASGGQTVGTLVLTPLFEAVLSKIGWRRTLQIQAVVVSVVCLPLATVFKLPSRQLVKMDTEQTLPSEEKEKLEVIDLGGTRSAACENDGDKAKDGNSNVVARAKANSPDINTLRGQPENGSRDSSATRENDDTQETETSELMKAEGENGPKSGEETVSSAPVNDEDVAMRNGGKMVHGCEMEKDKKPWHKYVKLMKDPRHGYFFVGTMATAVTVTFNGINLVSCMTTGGIPESTAAWLITLMCVVDLVSRLLLSFTGDYLPVKRILLLATAAGVGAASSFLLTRGTSLWIFIVYCVIAGFVRSVTFGLCYACVVELFGADRAVETLTSLQIAYGIGGLLASSVAGLSYDMTGTYQTTHYTCMGLWTLACLLYVVVYKWKKIPSCRSKVNQSYKMARL